MRTLVLLPTSAAAAGPAVRLGLRLRAEASTTGRCACGAVAELFEILQDGNLRRAAKVLPGRAYYTPIAHEDDCPAISPELQRALDRGEIHDPAGELLKGHAA